MGDRQPPPKPPAQPSSAAESGAGDGVGRRTRGGSWLQRRRGARSALNLARKLKAGRDLSPAQELSLQLTTRLACHAYNASLALFQDGETRQDGEPRALLGRLLELEKAVSERLQVLGLLNDADADPLAVLMRGGERR